MATPNLSELATTTLKSRTKMLADNYTNNTALLMRMKERGRVKTASGGETILQELFFQANSTVKRFSGYEVLNIQPSEVITSAEFNWKQMAVAVTISGLEELKNSGRQRQIELLSARIENAEGTMMNTLSDDLYSDGTANGGKQINGLQALVDSTPATGTVGGINSANWEFWRNQTETGTSATNVKAKMQALFIKLCRNREKPDIMPAGDTIYQYYWNSLQDQQRFTNEKMAGMGFNNLKFTSGAEVVLDGGVGGACPTGSLFMLNTKYIFWRPHADEDMIVSSERFSTNQHAMNKFIFWAGNATVSNRRLQGVLTT